MRPLCQFRSERAQLFRPACPPPEVVALVASNALLQGLRAFGATRACHKVVTGGALLTEIVAPRLPVTDILIHMGARPDSHHVSAATVRPHVAISSALI